MSVALVRHGRTRWNAERRLQGRADLPLDDEGVIQAGAAADLLAETPSGGGWRHVVCSPLLRARRTAVVIADRLALPAPTVDPALLERDYGQAEGIEVEEARRLWPDGAYPGGESEAELAVRSAAALETLLGSAGIVVVGHGSFLRSGIQALTGRPFPRIENGEVLLAEGSGPSFRSLARVSAC